MAEDRGQANAAAWLETITELVAQLDTAKDDDTAREAVAQEVHAGPLSVMVRDTTSLGLRNCSTRTGARHGRTTPQEAE